MEFYHYYEYVVEVSRISVINLLLLLKFLKNNNKNSFVMTSKHIHLIILLNLIFTPIIINI